MAKFDIMPYRGVNQGNVLPAPEWGRLAAGESFTVGEPVAVNAGGFVTESASNPDAVDFIGIAASCGDTVGATDPIGTFRTPFGQFTPASSPNLPTTGDDVTFWRAKGSTKFVTANFSTGGVGVLVTPTAAEIGDAIGLRLNGGVWFVDNSGGTTKIGRITDVLDAKGVTIRKSGFTGVKVVVEFTLDELTVVTVPTA